MTGCALCYGEILGPATLTRLGVLCWFCFVAALATGKLEPVEERVTVN